MAAIHGKGASILANQYDISAYLNSADTARTADTAETTTFGSTAKTYVAGNPDATLSMGGFFDGANGSEDSILSAALGATTLFTVAPQGAGTIGNRASIGQAYETSYSISAPVGDAVSISAEAQVTGGMNGGVILADLSARTSTGNLTAVDNATSTSNGLAAHIHVTAFTGTSITVKVQHSADNSTWVDLITFTAATAATSERKTVTGTVNRYLRVTSSGTITSATFAVAAARL